MYDNIENKNSVSAGQQKAMENCRTATPLVSVCMAMYNASLYIRECVDSVLAQSFKDFEFLIVDDGSDDDSVSIVRSYDDPRIRLIENKHDYIGSLNMLLEQARGKYIARMDADDVMRLDRLLVQYAYLERHRDVDIVCGEIHFIGRDTCPASTNKESDITLDSMAGGNVIAHPTVMLRTQIIHEKKLRYDRDYIYAEDYNLWVDALVANLHIVKLPLFLTDYRLSEGQMTNKKWTQQQAATEKVLDKVYRVLYPPVIGNADVLAGLDARIKPAVNNNKLTVIIPFLNEREEVVNTLKSIRDHAGDRVEIIIIDDCSDDGWSYEELASPYDVSYIRNEKRKGVAASRDLGVALCRTPYFLLLDAHMRFYDGKWPERLVSLLEKDDRVLLCCQSRFLKKDADGRVVHNAECPDVYGAFSTFRVDKYWPDIEWNQQEQQPGEDIEPIGNVLGAGYAASRRYWNHIRGLQGLRKYGCDEAMLSFKVWREGGRCLLVKDVMIGHIYRDASPYKHYMAEEVSNNLLTAYLTFSQSYYCYSVAIAMRKDMDLYARSMRILRTYKSAIDGMKQYLDSIYTRSFESVLQSHRRRLIGADDISRQDPLLRRVNEFVLGNPAKRPGLYEGIAGQLVWLCLYRKWNGGQGMEDFIQRYWDDICDAVRSRSLSWNFSEGLAGIGWACMYLYTRQILDDYPEQLLGEIDRQIQETDLTRIPSSNLAVGAGGLLAYSVLRKATGTPAWDGSYAEALKTVSRKIIEDAHGDLPSTFYAVFYLDMLQKGIEKDTYNPKVSEWLLTNRHIPSNRKYWKPTVFNGCIGAAIGLLDAECNYKNV